MAQVVGAVGPVDIQPATTIGNYLLSWDSVPGRTYLVEAGTTLTGWDEVTRVTAVVSRVNSLEVELPGGRTFWRVTEIGGTPTVSPIQAVYTLTGDQAQAVLSLTTGGEPPLEKVEFLADGVVLGEAQPGLGDTWTFTVVAGENPEVKALQARVTGADGTEVSTTTTRFLLADPSRFVPAGPGGERLYGQLIPIDSLGRLGAFFYYPEGVSDGLRQSGAYFEFPEDASTLTGTGDDTAIDFTDGAFFRGPQDAAPIRPPGASGSFAARGVSARSGSASPLRLASITPQEVNESFGRSSDAPIDLQFGGTSVQWQEGALGEDGWNGLKVRLPIGDFLLPGTQLVTEVVIGPGNRIDSLLVIYFGSWQPMPEGPVFEVPESDPLRVFLDYRGVVTARGTVIAQLPNGASLRGTASWAPPYFEISLEGRKIVVPALGALRGVLPVNGGPTVQAAISNGSSTALDEAEAALRGFQLTLRQVAAASEAQAPAGSPQAAVVPKSEISATAAALAAWAARLGSWAVDRTGQTLTELELTNVVKVIGNALKSVRGSADINFIGGVWSSVVTIDANKAVAGIGESTLSAVTSAALIELITIRERLVVKPLEEDLEVLAHHELPGLGPIEEVIAGSEPLDGPAERSSGGAATRSGDSTREAAVVEREMQRKVDALFGKLAIRADGSIIDAGAVSDLQLVAKLSAFTTLADSFDGYRRVRPGSDLSSPGVEGFEAAFNVLSVPIEASLNGQISSANGSGELARTQEVLRQFTVYGLAFSRLTGDSPLVPPELLDVMDQSVELLKTAILKTRPRDRQSLVTNHLGILGGVVGVSGSPTIAGFLKVVLDSFGDTNGQFRALLAGSPNCDALLQAILANPLIPFASLPPDSSVLSEGSTPQLSISGTYQSFNQAGKPDVTMQVNRGGQYLLARVQESGGGAAQKQFEIEGLLNGSELPGSVSFSCLGVSGATPTDSFRLTFTATADGFDAALLDVQDSTTTTFHRGTTLPFYPAAVVDKLGGVAGGVFSAAVRTPMHDNQSRNVGGAVKDVQKALLELHGVQQSGNSSAIRTQLQTVDAACGRLLASVSPQQLPIARHLLIQRLTAFAAVPATSTGPNTPLQQRLVPITAGQLDQWNQLLVAFRDSPARESGEPLMPQCSHLLNGEILPPTGNDTYTYDFNVAKGSASGGRYGGGILVVQARRTDNAHPLVPPVDLDLAGLFGQVGKGKSINDFVQKLKNAKSGGTSSDRVTVTSRYLYSAEALQGPVVVASAGAMIPGLGILNLGADGLSTDFAATFGLSGLTFMGPTLEDPPLPPLFLPLQLLTISGSKEIGFSAEATFGVGVMVAGGGSTGEEDIFGTKLAPIKAAPRRQFFTSSETAFDNNASVVKPCGMVGLRQFIAENRAILDDPQARITLLGMTDTTASDAHNLTLSQARNASVLAAMEKILGHPAGSAEVPVAVFSLGEQVARSDLPFPPPGLNETEIEVLKKMREVLLRVPEDQPVSVPGWRVVRILLNDTIIFDLNSL